MRIRRRFGAFVVLLLSAVHGAEAAEASGVLVEKVRPGSVGERAGLQPGDVLLSWSCAAAPPAFPQPSSGSVRSPYDLLPLQIEEAPRRPVTLRGRRGEQEMAWTLTLGSWEIDVHPRLAADLAALDLEGRKSLETGDFAAVERSWRSAADTARSSGESRLAAWFLDRLARALADAGRWLEADAAFREALAALEREPQPWAAAHLLRGWGRSFEKRADWDAAVERFQQALALDRTMAPESLAAARTLDHLGVTFAKRGDYPAAESFLRQALEIREKLAPGTNEVTWSLNNLGTLARRAGQPDRAEEYLTRGEELQRRLAPESTDRALFLQNLGNLAMNHGDLEKGESLYRQALAIFEKAAPGGDGFMDCLDNLAQVAIFRGDLATADRMFRRSLASREQKGFGELEVSTVLTNLGNIASRRGDLEAAEMYYRRGLEIQERFSPEGWEAAVSLGNLGILKASQGDFDLARTYLRRALAIEEKLKPGTGSVASILDDLGCLEADSGGDLATAEEFLRQARAIFEQVAPESLGVSEVLRHLGEIVARRGRLPEALALHRRSLELQRKLAPETTGEAEALYFLGRAERQAGRHEEGTRDLCRAIDVLDRQRGRIGGPQEARASFEATLEEYYQACLEGLIGLGRSTEAFHVLERGRARSFLDLLAEREIRLSDVPPELAAERRRVNAEYDRVQLQLTRLSAGRDDAEIQRLTGEIHDLRVRQEEILARIRQASPRSAALEAPRPLALAEARAVLDPGTVFLGYAVGPEKSWLFVVEPAGAEGPGLSVFPIALGTEALREEIEGFRLLPNRPDSQRAAVEARARRLYRLLIRPAGARITEARRILVSPAGPLHTLPFAALLDRDRWLGAWKPIHSVLSTTVYAELVRSRPARRSPGEEIAAFGDPLYPAAAPADPEVREAARRGFALGPLPFTRREVEEIAALYPKARTFLGRDATEEKAKSLAPGSRLVHFACHGLLDERFPLNSALALTLPENPEEGQDNGLLQAWEIFESVRLDADLVTLSTCDSALGQEMGGEGLLGLTRAFQYAGARSVLASLWSVSDASTAHLMKRFYGSLRKGQSKDEALQEARADLIRSRDFSHPYHWAAFQLAGDWR